jgi:hypothetical protein
VTRPITAMPPIIAIVPIPITRSPE